MVNPSDDSDKRPIIVKKVVKAGGGHHGGAWKVAYADFVTAMMAFFLLLWLLNVSTDEQKQAISDFFDPTPVKVSESKSGAGGVLGGLSMSSEGAMISNQASTIKRISGPATNNRSARKASDSPESSAKQALRAEENARFNKAKTDLEHAFKTDPSLKDLAKNLLVDITDEGLRVQMIDDKGRPMFARGSAKMTPLLTRLLQKVTPIIASLPNALSLRGHTDSVPYSESATYTNWELAADRANAARRALLAAGMKNDRIVNVIGYGDSEHLIPENPKSPRNRRISIVLLKEELSDPDGFKAKAGEHSSGAGGSSYEVPIGTFRRTPGTVNFP